MHTHTKKSTHHVSVETSEMSKQIVFLLATLSLAVSSIKYS